MGLNWTGIYNRLFAAIDQQEDCYFGGPKFIGKVQEVDPYFPDYWQYIEERRGSGKSTSRKSFFFDILMGYEEPRRIRIVSGILKEIEGCAGDIVSEIRGLLGGSVLGPTAAIGPSAWSAARLNDYLSEIDDSIAAGDFARSVSLSYTCLEGFYKAFVRRNIPTQANLNEIKTLSKAIKKYLRNTIGEYPDEALSMVNHISNTVDRARNQFSESHFDRETARWLSIFIRDLTNTQIRLLLHFM